VYNCTTLYPWDNRNLSGLWRICTVVLHSLTTDAFVLYIIIYTCVVKNHSNSRSFPHHL